MVNHHLIRKGEAKQLNTKESHESEQWAVIDIKCDKHSSRA